MKVSDEITTRPPHPNTVREVQAAREALDKAELGKCAAMQRHQQNWELTYSADAFASRRAKIEARRLFDEMELAALAAEEAARKYHSLYERHLAPLKDWYRRSHQMIVEDLCESLLGEVCRKNQAVIDLVDQASQDGVTLCGMTSLQELQADQLAFTCMKLKENVGLSNQQAGSVRRCSDDA